MDELREGFVDQDDEVIRVKALVIDRIEPVGVGKKDDILLIVVVRED